MRRTPSARSTADLFNEWKMRHGWSACTCSMFDKRGAFRVEAERQSMALGMCGRFTGPFNRLLIWLKVRVVVVKWDEWEHEPSCPGDVPREEPV